MYRDTVTIFCREARTNGDIWHPYLLKGVDVNTDRAWMTRNYGQDTNASINLHVPCKIDGAETTVAQYIYVTPIVWDDLAYKDGHITFRGGEDYCIILEGDYGFYDPIYDDDYRQGFLQYLKTNYDGVYTVTNVSKFSVISHFEIVGR